VTAITTGGMHACALFNTGKVKCWGSNSAGQLGDGTYESRNTPAEVPGLENVIAIAAGGGHTCALLVTREVKCFGDNYYGQLGDGTTDKRWMPTPVSGLTDAVSISTGDEHTCVITRDNKVKCWGKNLYFRIGSGTNDRIFKTPADVIDLGGTPLSIAPGYEHTCAVVEGGKVQCWGHNNYGQAGVDDTKKSPKVPTDVTGLESGAKSVSTGFDSSCAVTEQGRVLCWGWIGMYDSFTLPQEIDEMRTDMTAVSVGGDHICALTSNGVVKCLGENNYGQLGDGTTDSVYYGKKVNGLENVKSIATSMGYSCALTNEGRVFLLGTKHFRSAWERHKHRHSHTYRSDRFDRLNNDSDQPSS
jgi:alpha-tubulin suppressor-like RCC1 family protein